MKTLLLLSIIILSSCAIRVTDDRYKTFRPAKVQKVKFKKSKLSKEFRFNELTKRQQKKKAYKPGKIKCINFATYTNKSAKHYMESSRKINPEHFCTPR